MNWSNKWGEQDHSIEAQKVHDDTTMYGIGYYNQNGKHVPIEQIYSDPEGEAANKAMAALGVAEIRSIKLGNKTILVTVVGDLGLDFCEPGEKDTGWNIYHLPTLACFSSAVPESLAHASRCDIGVNKPCNCGYDVIGKYNYDKPELLNWMARVQENYPTSWQVLRLLTPDTYQDNGKTAKEIIQKWCLSVKVE